MKKIILFLFFTLVFLMTTKAQQLKIDGDYRARGEYSHGFGTLISNNNNAGLFVHQRARLKFGYFDKKISSFISFQDVSVWGDEPQITAKDNTNSFSLAEAWVKLNLSNAWAVKAGRQIVAYDDQRIFGGLDWAMQGRFHDALLVKYAKDNFKMDIGMAFNQNGPSRINTLFDPNNQGNARGVFDYKAMAYLWLHKHWSIVSGSLLFVNNTYQNLQGETPVKGNINRQTLGAHFKITPSKGLQFLVNLYAQSGKFSKNVSLTAYNSLFEINYKPGNTLFGAGYEILSGDADGASDGQINSFFPVFGTNHKFNGFMDYFYVGNHANSIGLKDLYAKVVAKVGKEAKLLVKGHYFSGDKQINNESYLGTEIDVVFSKKIVKYATLKVGYSHMFASEAMESLKNITNVSDTQNWGWAMLVVQPNFLHWKKKVNE